MPVGEVYIQEQIKRMIAFIHQEASEKVEEIEAKAEEEFIVEKTKILQKERERLSKIYKKKQKLIELEKIKAICAITNDDRLSILKAKESFMASLRDDVFEVMKNLESSHDEYKKILKFCIEECLQMIRQPKVMLPVVKNQKIDYGEIVIICREKDVAMIKDLVEGRARIDESNCLSDDSAGGFIASTLKNRIKVDSTFETRSSIALTKAAPQLRAILFGTNPHRKYME
ncbi:hypothetical protein ACOME3_010073 [Neoechinorhynchus agilis]